MTLVLVGLFGGVQSVVGQADVQIDTEDYHTGKGGRMRTGGHRGIHSVEAQEE